MSLTVPTVFLNCFLEIKKALSPKRVKENQPLAPYTSFKIGGKADLLVEPSSTEELALVLSIVTACQVPFRMMGHGSNLLVDDEGVRGVVIRLGENFSAVKTKGNLLTAQSGASLAAITRAAAHSNLEGMVGLCGVPGSLGGAVYMNAGAYGSEISDRITQAKVLLKDGTVKTLTKEQMHFSYRHSFLQEGPFILLEADFSLSPGQRAAILFEQMKELNHQRNEKQPMNYPSAGSVFKRPQGHYASALIDQCHLKGTTLGGAMVSPKHAGFIVNTGKATAQDVKDLIALVQERVYSAFHVALEPEIRIWHP